MLTLTKALASSYSRIYDAFSKLMNDPAQKADTCAEARSFMSKMERIECTFMTPLWDYILQRFNATSLSLQKTSIELGCAVKLLQSLREFVADLRASSKAFSNFEEQAKLLAVVKSYHTEITRRRKIPKRNVDDSSQTESHVYLLGIVKSFE